MAPVAADVPYDPPCAWGTDPPAWVWLAPPCQWVSVADGADVREKSVDAPAEDGVPACDGVVPDGRPARAPDQGPDRRPDARPDARGHGRPDGGPGQHPGAAAGRRPGGRGGRVPAARPVVGDHALRLLVGPDGPALDPVPSVA